MDIIKYVKENCEFDIELVERKDMRLVTKVNVPNEEIDILTPFITSEIVYLIMDNENTTVLESEINWEDKYDSGKYFEQIGNILEPNTSYKIYYPMKLYFPIRNPEMYQCDPTNFGYKGNESLTFIGSRVLNVAKSMILMSDDSKIVVYYDIVGDYFKLDIEVNGKFTIIEHVCY
jgi:hypothetical protein